MNNLKLCATAIALMFGSLTLNAQSFGSLFSKDSKSESESSTVSDVLTSVTGGLTVSSKSIAGEWKYVEPAIELSSDSALSNVAGSVVSSKIEDKLDGYCSKVGITAGKFAYVFAEDGTFTSNIGARKLGGDFTVDDNGVITLNYKAIGAINIGTLTASTTLTSTSLSLVFPADKLLKFLTALSSSVSSGELGALSSLIGQYDGLSIGFSLSGKAVQTVDEKTVENAVDKATSLFDKLF